MPYGSLAAKLAAERLDSLYKEYQDTEVIDAHSHFGIDRFWPNVGTPDEYIKHAKEKGVGACFAMPVGCPVMINGDTRVTLSYYEMEGQELKHYRVEETKDKIIRIPNLIGVNPYKEANDALYEMTKRKDFHFDYVPLIHPKYYSEEDIIEHKKRGAKVFKIHGIACGVNPKDIDEDFFRLLEKHKIKILVHTDYSKEDNILSQNSAMNWLEVLQKYRIRAYLAHAVRLDDQAIDIVNNDYRYIVGLGPDQLLGKNGQNYVDTDHFLDYCFTKFNENKIVFDIDYPWNLQDREDYNLEWNSVDRVKELLGEEQSQKVLKRNIINFMM